MPPKKQKKSGDKDKLAEPVKKHVIYVEIDDEITTVYDRVKKTPGRKQIVLVVPKRAVILQSVVNLRILKKKIEEDGKVISIITNDKSGRLLAMKAGIPVLEKLSSAKRMGGGDAEAGGTASGTVGGDLLAAGKIKKMEA